MEAQGELQQKGEDVEEPVPESSEFETSFKMTLPEDCVEYVVVLVEDISIKQSRSPLQQLETVRKTAMQLCDSLAKDYIWQRDEFKLDLKNQQGAWAVSEVIKQIETDMETRAVLFAWHGGVRRCH